LKQYNNSLIALACGDSYGSHYEIQGLHGATFSINSLPNIPKFPNVTDDTIMAEILYNHYIKYKTIKEDILLDEYKYWAETQGEYDGIGIHTKDVLLNNKKDKDSQGNGALMRNIPFGIKLIEDGYSFEKAVDMMNIDSSLTHNNDTIFLSNALALDLAINGTKALVKRQYKNLLDKITFGNTAWVLHSLAIVIETLLKKKKFLTGFKYIVSSGGDTDTNCAIFGAIFGCTKDITQELDMDKFVGDLLICKENRGLNENILYK
jgi:ADP-ribosylglycohydrolase